MSRSGRAITLLAVAISLATASTTVARGISGAGGPTKAETKLEVGKRLYRKYCGQCHALTAARAVGFGSNKGLGTDGGPSFNSLRVPFELSVLSIRQPFIGHEALYHKMVWNQIRDVSNFIAQATKHHPILAQPIDG